MKAKKYSYLKVLQANYGYGWDDLHVYDKNDAEEMAELKHDLRDYRENERNVSFRIIERRTLKIVA